MSVHIIVDRKRNVGYTRTRALKDVNTGRTIDHTVDWDDLQNPQLELCVMTEQHAGIVMSNLKAMGFENLEVIKYAEADSMTTMEKIVIGVIACILGTVVGIYAISGLTYLWS